MTNSNLESIKNNFGLEYLTKGSIWGSVEVDFEFFGLELVRTNFNMESTKEDSITQSLVWDSIEYIRVIMIRCVFIQTNETMPKGQEEFIHIYKIIFAISVEFKHPNFGIKGGTIH